MMNCFKYLNSSKSTYIYIYMAIAFNIFVFGSSPNLVAQDCGNCSNTWTTGASTTFNYGECIFYFDYEYRECEDSTETYREFRIGGIQNITSECDTVSSQQIYEYSIKLLLSTYYQMFNVNYYDTNKVTLLSKPCIAPADMSGYIELCGEGTNCHKVDYNMTGVQEFTEVIGSKTFTKNYMPGMACGAIGPCGTELPQEFYTIPPGPIYYQIHTDPLDIIDCTNPCFWRLEGNDNVEDEFHFLGTTNNKDLRVKTNDIERLKIFSDGQGFYSHEGRKPWNIKDISNPNTRYMDETNKFDFMFNNGIVVGNSQSWWLEDGITNSENRTSDQDGSITFLPHRTGSIYHLYNAQDFGFGISSGRYPGINMIAEGLTVDGFVGREVGINASSQQPAYAANNILTVIDEGRKVGIGTIPGKSSGYNFNSSEWGDTYTTWKSAGPEGMLTVSDTYYHEYSYSQDKFNLWAGNPVILRLERRDNGSNDGDKDYKLISAGHHNAESFLVRANAKVGINTTNEDALLNIKGLGDDDETFNFIAKNSSNTNLFNIRDDGNIGVNTTSLVAKFNVKGDTNDDYGYSIIAKNSSDEPNFYVKNNGIVGVSNKLGIGIVPKDNLHVIGNMRINPVDDENALESSALTGTHSDYLLAVEGKIVAQEIIVTLSNWADHVFYPNYKLTSLLELESRIKELGHLPGIPSETEVKENGYSVNEMQVKMLEKIEELTLYMIELKKENEKLKTQISQIEGIRK